MNPCLSLQVLLERKCNVCGSDKTYIHRVKGKSYHRWTRNRDGHMCQKCYLARYKIEGKPIRPPRPIKTVNLRTNPPRTVYDHSSWCKRCDLQQPMDTRFCRKCGVLVRHTSRHTKKEVKRY